MIPTREHLLWILVFSMLVAVGNSCQSHSVLVTYDVHIVVHSQEEVDELKAKYENCEVTRR